MRRTPGFKKSLTLFARRIRRLIFNPVFMVLTLFGNLLIAVGATSVYFFERGRNETVHSLLDTVWWAVSTVTTVGYGDVTPVTPQGRLIGIVMMIIGTALFWSYTALFAEALVTEDISDIEGELRSLSRKLRSLAGSGPQSTEHVAQLLRSMDQALDTHALAQPKTNLESKPKDRRKET